MSVSIISYEYVGDKIIVRTDNASRPNFVYFANKFANVDDLQREIEKSLRLESLRNTRDSNRIQSLRDDFTDRDIDENIQVALP